MTNFIAPKACSITTIMVMMVSKTEDAFYWFSLFNAIFSNMSSFITSKAFYHPLLLINFILLFKVSNMPSILLSFFYFCLQLIL